MTIRTVFKGKLCFFAQLLVQKKIVFLLWLGLGAEFDYVRLKINSSHDSGNFKKVRIKAVA